ncbi:unnamed protein product [Lathyrus oleraceus]|uniref:Uncharacterized protein n=1 Tax=Pisum sativum TaxID=3888 RepID=A0A9D5A194_PEA|nr:uncharacterized protein LOC127108487 [Pisum sativum]KAI5391761.1 hypothetical protein KIW84_076537 [Pisum sativum]
MSNNQANGVYGHELAYLLRDNINNKVKGFKSMCRKMVRTNAEIMPVYESTSRRRKFRTTLLLKKKIFSFSFPTNFDVTCFSGIDNMLSNLKSWEVQCRKRSSKICDTYYVHASINGGRKLRSVTQVVNNLLPEGYAKLKTRKRKKKDGEHNGEENNFEIEANENNIPQIRVDDLLPPSLSVPRKKRNYKRKVQKRNHVELEKNIALGYPQEVLDNKENNVEAENVVCPLQHEDKENNIEVGNILCPAEIKDKVDNHVDENVSFPTTEEKENNFEVGNDVFSEETKNTENNSEAGNAFCPQNMEGKENNMNVGDVSIEALLYPQEGSDKVSLNFSEVQASVPINEGVLPNMLKDYDVSSDWGINNYEVLPEITEDFSEYDDLIASFLN